MKKIFTTIVALFAIGVASTAPISEQQARRIAIEFFSGGTRSGAVEVSLEWSGRTLQNAAIQRSVVKNSSDALLYIYNRGDNNGFVIVSGDDKSRPIIAFSHEGCFDAGNIAPSTRALLSAWCEQIEATGNGVTPSQKYSASVGVEECRYDTALWNQYEPFNAEAPIFGGERSVTGCVATAMAIIAYYHKWPEQGVGSTPEYSYEYNGTSVTIPSNTLGRKYDYDNMLSDYSKGYSASQGAAVAALMKDMGTSVQMMYSPIGSGAFSRDTTYALLTYFGYSKSCQLINCGNKSENEWFDMLKTNIATYGPTYFSGNSTQSAHAFVLDGYTSENYFHINYGWGGVGNGYYWIPDIEYFNQQDAVFYLTPDKDGTSTYTDSISLRPFTSGTTNYYGLSSLATAYKSGEAFTILIGGISNTGNISFSGDVRVVHCNNSGDVKGTIVTSRITNLPPAYYVYFNPLSCRISSTIEEGDRIRFQYKGIYSQDWQWARGAEANCVDEILLKATPEEVAKSLDISYSKSNKVFTFNSTNAIQYTVKKAVDNSVITSGEVASHTATAIDLSTLEAGEYLFEFASGGRPYVLRIVF